ncbi:hypothetical protein SKAU_G00099290 [Synaphobranchus kaupii]|uniref:Interleukin-6 n=1 Tax=Synaphobranchus kaupii TaxID=118154 RepID=A0A9Q1J787_SYNKA|nr:hypothetical protein SKAU_G00099290 [Synaphobranchus kaupii]
MQSLSRTVVVIALVLALTGVREVNGAPIINWDLCTESSVGLNKLAQDLANKVLGSSPRSLYNIDEQVVLVEPSDMCDPAGLKMDSKPCIKKIITALGNYSRIFRKEGLFLGSARETARKVAVTVSKLLGQLGTLFSLSLCNSNLIELNVLQAEEPQGSTVELDRTWMQYVLARYSVERLLSFSILVARVFASGNPAAHGNAPSTSCHQR